MKESYQVTLKFIIAEIYNLNQNNIVEKGNLHNN